LWLVIVDITTQFKLMMGQLDAAFYRKQEEALRDIMRGGCRCW
jgi:hypothetical protein